MAKIIDITGQRYGKLTVIRFLGINTRWGHSVWECRCDCGKLTDVARPNLKPDSYKKRGSVRSCGCLLAKGNNFKHGQARTGFHTPEFILWSSAKQRAKKAGVPFNIEITDIVIPARCPVFGIPLKRASRHFQHDSPSLDRVIPASGYVKGNIWVISHHANAIKSNATLGELEYLVRALKEKFKIKAVA